MTHFVALTPKGEMREFLTTNDADYARWLMDQYTAKGTVKEGDILAEVASEEYERLCVNARYRFSLRKAAEKM